MMKKWVITRNCRPVTADAVPLVGISQLREAVISQCRVPGAAKRPAAFFGVKKENGVLVIAALADDENSRILLSSALLESGSSYDAITMEIPAFHMFERELWEEHGITPAGHPWLKPVRLNMDSYPFFEMDGGDIHQVAVGPVHAGIIEPGHFRFMCTGEQVHHLEIQLGYQHRNIESLFVGSQPLQYSALAESIVGDSVVGHTSAYVHAVEALSNTSVPKKAMAVRSIALELERIAMHVGDLGAICNDIAYLTGSSIFGALRTVVINTTLELCGSRFGRGLIRPGGVVHDIGASKATLIRKNLAKVKRDAEGMCGIMFSSPGVLSRLEGTGVVSINSARELGMTGMAARASGLQVDVRADHPWGMYRYCPVHKMHLEGGDVFARAYIRYVEIMQSIRLVNEILDSLPDDGNMADMPPCLEPSKIVVSMAESWRGAAVHCVLTDSRGNTEKYKVIDPSFKNWHGLALAARGNGISDFPLCNKSFNLSYCGNDL